MNRTELINRLAADHVGSQLAVSYGVRTAGEIKHIKDTGPVKRRFMQQHEFNPKDLKGLTKVLWQVSIALGHISSASATFAKMKSVRISPDGRLGGNGYDKAIKDMRKEMYTAMESLSGLVDTLHDEVTGPHWHPEDLPPEEEKEVEEMIGDAEKIQRDPESFAERDFGKANPDFDMDEEEEDDASPLNVDDPVAEEEPEE